MRTTLHIDNAIIQEISKYTGITNKTEIIDKALTEFLAKLKRQNLKNAYGKIKINLDVRNFRNMEING